ARRTGDGRAHVAAALDRGERWQQAAERVPRCRLYRRAHVEDATSRRQTRMTGRCVLGVWSHGSGKGQRRCSMHERALAHAAAAGAQGRQGHEAAMPTVQVNDIQIYCEIDGEGAPLVLLAGLGTDISEWDSIMGWLAQTYRVSAFDNRGAG